MSITTIVLRRCGPTDFLAIIERHAFLRLDLGDVAHLDVLSVISMTVDACL